MNRNLTSRPVLWTAAAIVIAAGTLAGCETNHPRRVGPAVADPENKYEPSRGAPAVASDGEVYSGRGSQSNAALAVRESTTPTAASALPGSAGSVVTPTQPTAQPTAQPTTQPTTPPPSQPITRPIAQPTAQPTAPANTTGRVGGEPAIDLVEPSAPAPSQPTTKPATQPTTPPAAKPAPTTAAKPAQPTREPAIELIETTTPPPTQPTTKPATPNNPSPTEPTAAPTGPVDTSVQTLSADAVALILAMSQSPQPEVRANAVEAAGLEPVKLESVIISGLTDSNEGVQSIAAMTVGKQKLAAIAPRVRPLLASSSVYVETAAIMALIRNGETVDDAKMSRLGEILFTNQSPRIRAHVAFIVGEIRNPSALPMLRQAADVKMPLAARAEFNTMMLQITEAMVKLGDQDQVETIRAALQPGRSDDLETTALAVQILGELGDKRPIDHMVFLSAYRDPRTKLLYPAEVRMQVASSLAKLGLDRGGFIADEFYKNEDPALRAQAAAVYGDTGRPEHLAKLETLMRDPVEQVRVSAAGAVLKIAKRASGVNR